MLKDTDITEKRESNIKGNPFPFEVVHFGEPANNMKLMHWHDFLEISYINEGSGIYQIEDKTLPVKKGDVVIINNIEKHKVNFDPSTPLFETVIHFDSNLIWSSANNPLDHNYLRLFLYNGIRFYNNPELDETNRKAVELIISDIAAEYRERRQFYELMIKGKLLTLITMLIRQCNLNETDGQDFIFKRENIERLDSILLYLKNNFDRDVSLSSISKEFYMNSSYFSEFFKKNIGIGFSEYISRLRINKVLSLLEEDILNTTEIAFSCGFNNLPSFFNTFKKCMGMSPGEYKKAKFSL
jgi:AraC-like DNA-binding protein